MTTKDKPQWSSSDTNICFNVISLYLFLFVLTVNSVLVHSWGICLQETELQPRPPLLFALWYLVLHLSMGRHLCISSNSLSHSLFYIFIKLYNTHVMSKYIADYRLSIKFKTLTFVSL